MPRHALTLQRPLCLTADPLRSFELKQESISLLVVFSRCLAARIQRRRQDVLSCLWYQGGKGGRERRGKRREMAKEKAAEEEITRDESLALERMSEAKKGSSLIF